MVVDTLNLKTPVPCVQGFFNERLVTYTTQVSPKQISNLLGHDPRSKNWKRLPSDELREVYEFLQRKTVKSRREGISGYIEERFGPDALTIGAFPSISIAFQQATEFHQFGSPVPAGVGTLMVDISPSNVRVLIDGLGRVTGALDLIEEGKGDLLSNFTFPVTLYLPKPGTKDLTWKEMGQLFHDFNFKVQPVARQLAISLDTSDIYISLASRLAESPFIVDHGGVAERAASLGSKSTELVVQTVLVRTVRGACEGRQFQESNLATTDNPNLDRKSFNSVLASIDGFFAGIANRMGTARFTDRQSLHLTSPGWQALGIIHHDLAFKLKMSAAEQAPVLDKIAGIDWGRGNPDWITLGLGHPELDKKTGAAVLDSQGRPKIALSGAGRTSIQKLIDYVRDKAGLSALLGPDDDTAVAAEDNA